MIADTQRRVPADAPTIPYTRAPRAVSLSGVPIFAAPDGYTSNYDDIARAHLKALDESGFNPFMSDATWDLLDRSTMALLHEIVTPGDRLLDAGVGLGRLLAAFPKHERHGVDISLDYLARTRRSGIHTALARLEQLPFPDGAFDCVISTDVLEHVLDLYTVTKEINRVLKPGGHLVLRVPLEEDMRTYYDYREFDLVHLRRFDLWGLRLHFERVLGMEYVLHRREFPLYRGISTSRLRPVENGDALRLVLDRLPESVPGRADMVAFSTLTPDKFEAFMNAVSIHHPAEFEALVEVLAGHLEINIVFRKPAEARGQNFG